MDKPARREPPSPRDFNGLFAQTLLRYLELCAPEGSVERVLQLAGEARSVRRAHRRHQVEQLRAVPQTARGSGRGAGRAGQPVDGREAHARFDSISRALRTSLCVSHASRCVRRPPGTYRFDGPASRAVHGDHRTERVPDSLPFQRGVRAVPRELCVPHRCVRGNAEDVRVPRCRGPLRGLPARRCSVLPGANALGVGRQRCRQGFSCRVGGSGVAGPPRRAPPHGGAARLGRQPRNRPDPGDGRRRPGGPGVVLHSRRHTECPGRSVAVHRG